MTHRILDDSISNCTTTPHSVQDLQAAIDLLLARVDAHAAPLSEASATLHAVEARIAAAPAAVQALIRQLGQTMQPSYWQRNPNV